MAASARSTANLAANVLAHTGNAGRQMIGAMTGVVVSAGKMDKTVKVRLWGQRWEKHVQKSFQVPHYHLVHDPNNSVRQGDVISIAAGWRASKDVRHIVRHIVAPYGPPIDERPPVPSEQDLYERYAAQREAKLARRAVRDEERAAVQAAERAEKAEKRARWAAADQERKERKEQKMGEVRAALEHVVD